MARPVARRGEGRRRVLDAALALFAEHGVSGTSLQMIADALGVTKAAVFYQFRSKDEIVLAVLAAATEQLEQVVVEAEAQPSPSAAQDRGWEGLVDLAVTHGTAATVLRQDRAVAALLDADVRLRTLTARLTAVLHGPGAGVAERVRTSVVGNGLVAARSDPLLADLDDDVLRQELARCVRSLRGLPPG